MDSLSVSKLTFKDWVSLPNPPHAVLPFTPGLVVQVSAGADTDTLIVTGVDRSLAGTVELTLVKQIVKDEDAEG